MTAIAKQLGWHALQQASADEDAKVAPPWTVGVSHPHSADVMDVSRPPSRERLWKTLLEWVAAAALVPLAVLALLAVGIPLVLIVRLIVDVLSWVIAKIL